MPRIVCLGEALFDLFAPPGEALGTATAFHPAPGGAPANVAVALARLGASVGFVGLVGADDLGAMLIDLLRREGVDITHFVADPRAPTTIALVASPSPTEQRFAIYRCADDLLRQETLPRAYLEAARIYVYGSISLAGASREAAQQGARWVRGAGGLVLFDVNLRPALWTHQDEARRAILHSVDLADVVKLNERELEFLTGSADSEHGAPVILARGPRLCCVSLGAQGSYFTAGRAKGRVSTVRVQARDTTGSGDAFVAGLALGLDEAGRPPEMLTEPELCRILRFANACGALAATQVGGMAGMPSRARVERLLAEEVAGGEQ